MAEEEKEPGAPSGSLAAAQILAAASREKADAFVDKQNALADLQIEDLKRENRVRHWSLRVRHVSDVLKLAFELALAFIVIAVAIGLGFEIWWASHADGLVIEAFTVPPAMADKGLTGQVVASKLLDRLATLQSQTTSTRAASSFANDWTNDIKVEIPDTGVSLGEVVRFLRATLGHEMHLSGEMYQSPQGAVLTVRMDNEAGQTFTDSSGNLDALIQRAALAVYAQAQPYRYGVYLYMHDRTAEAYAVSKALAETGPESERAWGYIGMTNGLGTMGRFEEELHYALLAHKIAPDMLLAGVMVMNAQNSLDHDQAQLDAARMTAGVAEGRGGRNVTAQWRVYSAHVSKRIELELTGDFRPAAEVMRGDEWFAPVFIATEDAVDLAFAHDPKGAEARLAPLSQNRLTAADWDSGSDNAALSRALGAMQRGDLRAAIAVLERDLAVAHDIMVRSGGTVSDRGSREGLTGPLLAVLYAQIGDPAKADAMLKHLPDDNDAAARAHGKVAALRGNWTEAARWFALVSARSPEIPYADTDWGAMLLAKGDLSGAIAKFESANRKGPHFADPLEMWGEALIAKNRSDLALAKFSEGSQCAPAWGRLHLKWGEALWWSGDKAGARKQFAIAAGLDMTPSEKAELAKVSRG